VPADHAFKTMTMEAFPQTGTQLASVHPCRHASVMKKFIDRMEAVQEDDSPTTASPAGKRRWLGGVMRKVTGGDKDKKDAAAAGAAAEDEEPKGVQVDFYLVIFLKFIASIVPTIEVDSTTAT
jgi:ubiquitin-like-conjugating enzyme ATG3